MGLTVTVNYSQGSFELDPEKPKVLFVKEDEDVTFLILTDDPAVEPILMIDSNRIDLILVDPINGMWSTSKSDHFKWCFGNVLVTVSHEQQSLSVNFEALMQKRKITPARKMIEYLIQQNNGLLDVCVIRGSELQGAQVPAECSPELIVNTAEEFLNKLALYQPELVRLGRSRLIQKSVPPWVKTRTFEPSDAEILENLDCLVPSSATESDVVIQGRSYSLEGGPRQALVESHDVFENQVLLGGLFSIQRALLQIKDMMHMSPVNPTQHEDYERFERLIITFTSESIIQRCERLIFTAHGLIEKMLNVMRVSNKGELQPRVTPYVRSSRLYRPLFNSLHTWYSLGRLNPNFSNTIRRLQSLSKIYEVFLYFKLIKQLISSGMTASLENYKPHPTLGKYVPTEVALSNEAGTLTIYFEPTVPIFTEFDAQHGQLYDVYHQQHWQTKYKHWNPDFIIKYSTPNRRDRYFILDAKYSYKDKVTELLNQVVNKYYWGTAIYDETTRSLQNKDIAGVMVIYPLSEEGEHFSYMGRPSLNKKHLTVPMIGGYCVNAGSNDLSSWMLEKIQQALQIAG